MLIVEDQTFRLSPSRVYLCVAHNINRERCGFRAAGYELRLAFLMIFQDGAESRCQVSHIRWCQLLTQNIGLRGVYRGVSNKNFDHAGAFLLEVQRE